MFINSVKERCRQIDKQMLETRLIYLPKIRVKPANATNKQNQPLCRSWRWGRQFPPRLPLPGLPCPETWPECHIVFYASHVLRQYNTAFENDITTKNLQCQCSHFLLGLVHHQFYSQISWTETKEDPDTSTLSSTVQHIF